MRTKKVAAFTLSELLVVLVISSIVISITFVVLGLVQKQISQIQKNYKDQQEILLLKRVLLSDISTHDVFFERKENQLYLYSSKDTLQYEFTSNYILRKKDTFNLKIKDKQFLLDNKIVKTGWVDAIHLEFNQSYTAKKIFVFKEKDAAHYLNH
jgi:prepilin-type N-terminal cleavage/methylation domain-containing protein